MVILCCIVMDSYCYSFINLFLVSKCPLNHHQFLGTRSHCLCPLIPWKFVSVVHGEHYLIFDKVLLCNICYTLHHPSFLLFPLSFVPYLLPLSCPFLSFLDLASCTCHTRGTDFSPVFSHASLLASKFTFAFLASKLCFGR